MAILRREQGARAGLYHFLRGERIPGLASANQPALVPGLRGPEPIDGRAPQIPLFMLPRSLSNSHNPQQNCGSKFPKPSKTGSDLSLLPPLPPLAPARALLAQTFPCSRLAGACSCMPSLPLITSESSSPSDAAKGRVASRIFARQDRQSPSQDAPSNTTDDCDHSKSCRCDSPQLTDYVYHRTSDV
jgi:hypothetical protein